jgi:hypothetical protein
MAQHDDTTRRNNTMKQHDGTTRGGNTFALTGLQLFQQALAQAHVFKMILFPTVVVLLRNGAQFQRQSVFLLFVLQRQPRVLLVRPALQQALVMIVLVMER